MLIIRNPSHHFFKPGLALTIGNFDGVHLGHQKIIHEVKSSAAEKGLASAIMTFEPHPVSFLKPNQARDFRITSLAQKLKIFQQHQINRIILMRFDLKIAAMSAQDFIAEVLIKSLNVKHLSIGYDFTFGKNRQGNFKLLEQAAQQFDFELKEISAHKELEQICSSSLIRKFISEGKIIEANKFLGDNFKVCGLVNEGRKLGRQLGFPTANLSAHLQMIKPKFGVYRTRTFIASINQEFPSITNFGIKPTINHNSAPIFETHIPSFNGNIYGKKIEVKFLDFIREEKKFSSLEELKKQIAEDLLHIF